MTHRVLTRWGKVRLMSTPAFACFRRFRTLAIGVGGAGWALGCGSGEEAAAPDPGTATPNVTSSLGYNLDYPGDWTNLPPFIDQMKNSRAPHGNCSDADAECD